jgi:hypothetical protein
MFVVPIVEDEFGAKQFLENAALLSGFLMG